MNGRLCARGEHSSTDGVYDDAGIAAVAGPRAKRRLLMPMTVLPDCAAPSVPAGETVVTRVESKHAVEP